jgi:type III restriction enzyme
LIKKDFLSFGFAKCPKIYPKNFLLWTNGAWKFWRAHESAVASLNSLTDKSGMSKAFFENPILNSPYEEPQWHHPMTDDGVPTDGPLLPGRRPSSRTTPVPKPRKDKGQGGQASLGLASGDGTDAESRQDYGPTPVINEIRRHVASWRALPSPNDWDVTPTTQNLLRHWRGHGFQDKRPFFCQIEAVEIAIWLAEVARKTKRYRWIWEHLTNANEEANPGLMRIALKMATGAGKTTVMAMLIAWQTLNAVRMQNSNLYTKGFLIISPGITIRDRLQVLLPSDLNNYYKNREIVPQDMLRDIQKAQIVITNYHALQLREIISTPKTNRAILRDIPTKETEGEMVRRAAQALMGCKGIVVINDEAHHCYREKPGDDAERPVDAEEKEETERQKKAARVWINGIEAFKRKMGVKAIYDLSATPFFLRGSGYTEGTLFPWTVSDFSLMDAIECGIVKLPRVPVADNYVREADAPIFRNLWEHVGKRLPKKGRAKGGVQGASPHDLPDTLQGALQVLYKHYEHTDAQWRAAGLESPPVFIVVCNNTSTSKLVHEWIAGWQDEKTGQMANGGHLPLFSNFGNGGQPLSRPRTLLIDSQQLESGEALDKDFRTIAAAEIEAFRRERIQRGQSEDISDSELLREVMNTVGKPGRLGADIRCVVSVSMLTEGWDANTVTHILGVRAFGTQLLCEQVVGRALRRYSYEVDERGRFTPEYADILGIPFNFTSANPPTVAPAEVKRAVRVRALPERNTLNIRFPRVLGYRLTPPNERLTARFGPDCAYTLDPERLGFPTRTQMEGMAGQGHTLTPYGENTRTNTVAYLLAEHIVRTHLTDADGAPKCHLFGQVKAIVDQWLAGGYLECKGGTAPWMLADYATPRAEVAERIYNAIALTSGGGGQSEAMLDPYNPHGSTAHVDFATTRDTYRTAPEKCPISHVVCDGNWEAECARVLEAHPRVLAYAKNDGMGFAIPYKDGSTAREYRPDFLVRIDDGRGPDDPLILIVEVKGYRGENAKQKAETVRGQWLPAINARGDYGRWDFVEFTDPYEMEDALAAQIDQFVKESTQHAQKAH